MRTESDGVNEEILHVFRHLGLRTFYLGSLEGQVRFYAIVLTQEQVLIAIYQVLQILITLLRNSDDGCCFTRNCITHVTALYARQASLEVRYCILEEAEEQLNRIRTLQVNIATRVTALAALDLNAQSDIAFFGLHRLIGESRLAVDTSGATYIEFAFGLRVQIQQVFTFEPTAFEIIRSIHAGFFIDREERLQRRMNRILISQDSHGGSHTDTVVCAQRCTIGRYPFAIILDIRLDRIFLEIERFIRVLLGHHIHVALEDHTGTILHTRRSRFTNEHVADLILQRLQTEALTVIN